MAKLLVKKPGFFTTVQDVGRIGYQRYGVPVTGVMDHFAHRVGNILVGNPEGKAVLEMTLLGPELGIEGDTVIAVTGGDLGAVLDGSPMPLWTSVRVTAGSTLAFMELRKGCRAYLAVAGGIDVPLVMDSLSTYTRGKIGGYDGRALKAGDVLDTGRPAADLKLLDNRSVDPGNNDDSQVLKIRVIPGPQEDAFTPEGINTFYSAVYQVTKESDRMGYRLQGEIITHLTAADIISDGVAMGAIQVTGYGMPIVMMADRQTTGGYTKIANVITADLPKMAQTKQGDQITFHRVTVEEAQAELLAQEKRISNYRELLCKKCY